MKLYLMLAALWSLAAFALSIQAADPSKYRDLQLGMPLADVAKDSGRAQSTVKVISSRPERDRNRGLTESDMVQSMSSVYGTAAPGSSAKTPGTIAQWEGTDTLLSLFPPPYYAGFELVLSSKATMALAEQAILESARRNRIDAPRFEAALRRNAWPDARLADEKASLVKKPGIVHE